MTLNVVVRPIAASDYEWWLPLWIAYNEFYGRTGATALPAQVTAMTWSRFLDTNEAVRALVAEAQGKIIGFAHYLFHRSTISTTNVCYLQDLFTAEAARGLGVATALIEAVYTAAEASGANRVYWQTHETNQVARRLYDKLAERSGFIVYRKPL